MTKRQDEVLDGVPDFEISDYKEIPTRDGQYSVVKGTRTRIVKRETDCRNQANKSVMDALQTEGLIFLAEKAGFVVDYLDSSKELKGYGYRKEITSVSFQNDLLISRKAVVEQLRLIRQNEQRIFNNCLLWLASNSEDVKLPEVLLGKENLFASFKKSFHGDKILVDGVNNAISSEDEKAIRDLCSNEFIKGFHQMITEEIDFVFTLMVLFENKESKLNGRLTSMAETRMDNFLIELLRMNGRIVNVKKVRKPCRDNAFYKNSITNIKNANGVEVFNAKTNKACFLAQQAERVIIDSSVL